MTVFLWLEPHGEGVCGGGVCGGVCVCVDTFSFASSNLPASCQRLFAIILPWLFLPPFEGFSPFEGLSQASCMCSPKGRNWNSKRSGWIEKRMEGRAFHLVYPLPQLCVILLSDSDSCSHSWVLPNQYRKLRKYREGMWCKGKESALEGRWRNTSHKGWGGIGVWEVPGQEVWC